MIITLRRLFIKLSFEDQAKIVGLGFLSFFSAAAELISITAILPLLSLIITPEKAVDLFIYKDILNYFKISGNSNIVIFSLSLFILIVFVSACIRLSQVYLQAKFSHHIGSLIANKIIRNALTQNFSDFSNSSSNSLVNIIMIKINSLVFDVLIPLFSLISTTLMLLFILISLFIFNTTITFAIVTSFSSIFLLIYSLSKNYVKSDSISISDNLNELQKILQEANGAFIDIKINNLYKYFSDIFFVTDSKIRKARSRVQLLVSLPRIGIESLGLILVTSYLIFGFENGNALTESIPLIALYALSLQKILPLINNIFSSFTLILSNYKSVDEILDYYENIKCEDILFNEKPLARKKFTSWKKIELKNIEYEHGNNHKIFDRLNLILHRSEHIGIIGSTGSGKSTLLNLLLALNKHKNGEYEVDGIEIWPNNHLIWRNEFSYVSQNIFLLDSSISDNITLGTNNSKIDYEKLRKVCAVALIYEFSEKLPLGINTIVGERGMLLSGGQRQRIAIARALYKECSILILDEATSALDNDTESMIIDNIINFDEDLTIIMVAHRMNSLQHCSRVYKINNFQLELI